MVGVGAAAVSGGLGLAGSVAGGMFGQSNARQAWRTQKKILQRKYQYTMDDLRKAGLNPMLAMGHGPTTPGSPPMAPTPDFASPLANSARYLKTSDEKKLLKAQEEAAISSAQEIKARASLVEMEAAKAGLMLNHWVKDPGLSSAAAYREAYGSGKIGSTVSAGKGFIDTVTEKLGDAIPSFSRPPAEKPKPEKQEKSQPGIATRKETSAYKKRRRHRTY